MKFISLTRRKQLDSIGFLSDVALATRLCNLATTSENIKYLRFVEAVRFETFRQRLIYSIDEKRGKSGTENERYKKGRADSLIYLGACFKGPERASLENDSVPLTQDEGNHPDHNHQ